MATFSRCRNFERRPLAADKRARGRGWVRESRPRRRRAASAFTRVSFRRSAQQRATELISVYLIPSTQGEKNGVRQSTPSVTFFPQFTSRFGTRRAARASWTQAASYKPTEHECMRGRGSAGTRGRTRQSVPFSPNNQNYGHKEATGGNPLCLLADSFGRQAKQNGTRYGHRRST